jgi:hypothetical protein
LASFKESQTRIPEVSDYHLKTLTIFDKSINKPMAKLAKSDFKKIHPRSTQSGQFITRKLADSPRKKAAKKAPRKGGDDSGPKNKY